MSRITWIALLAFVLLLILLPIDLLQSRGAAQTNPETRKAAIQRLKDSLSQRGHVKTNRATGLVDFVRLNRDATNSLVDSRAGTQREKSFAFFHEHGKSFGLTNPGTELRIGKEQSDQNGGLHLTFNQTYKGVPVFAGVLKTHFNSAGNLRVVNGVVVPDIELNSVPSRTSEEAAAVALAKVKNDSLKASALTARGSKLYIYRTGLTQGIPGENHLVWEIEVANNVDVREFVYVDAHSAKFVDQITGIYQALDRRVYDGENIDQFPPPNFPFNPFWIEGDHFPTGVARGDEVIAATKETYDLFKNGFGRDSFDDLGSTMYAIFDSGVIPGNAFASPINHLTMFGMDLTSDDVVGHEWTHVYTHYTSGLISQWQPGALNEAYSDIFGETVDLLNVRGLDTPGGIRTYNDCVYDSPKLQVNSPASVQGDYVAAKARFGPALTPTGVTGNIVLVDDGVAAGTSPHLRTDGCQTSFRNAAQVRGNIALIDAVRSGCRFAEKVKNAQLNGVIAVIVSNDIVSGDFPTPMLDYDPSITIPSILIGYSDGQTLRSRRLGTVNGTLKGDDDPASPSYRWLIGEGTFFQRDMWNPRCDGNPGKTSDREYFCETFDNGGVHLNSGIPNHGYALLVDGGTYNGQTIQPIGLTKAAHIYFRALSVYQTPTSDFADHAEALEASASDLVDVNLPDLQSGNPSGQIITSANVEQVHKATLAVELRTPPAQCGFKPLLAQNPPNDNCAGSQMIQTSLFEDNFESDPLTQWSISREVADESTFTPRDWIWVHSLPDGRPGSAFFALDPYDLCNFPEPGEAGVLHLNSPVITLPALMSPAAHLSFEHWLATEEQFDGGQVMISVNDGPFKLIPPKAFIFNPYNTTLFPPVPGMWNPRAGQPAFSGADGGSLQGSWGTSIVDLTGHARGGDRVRFRWDFSTDICVGTDTGWYVDNVRVYACQPR